jgi:hypothetical protein
MPRYDLRPPVVSLPAQAGRRGPAEWGGGGGGRTPLRPRCAFPSTSAGRSRTLLGMQAQYEHSPPSSSASTSTASKPENCVAY